MPSTKKLPSIPLSHDNIVSAHLPEKIKKGEWWYRRFYIVTKGWHWKILGGGGDNYPVKSLKAARLLIDSWYDEGSVDY